MVPLTPLLASYSEGLTLPQAFYTDETIFAEDLRRIFSRHWLFAGHSCEVPHPGDYFTLEIGNESLIIIRDQRQLHAHFNVCRHRGSKIALGGRAQAKTLVCPYHQWSYRPNGELVGARLMGADFNRCAYRLVSAHVRELAGLVFVCFAPEPPDFAEAFAAIAPQLQPHGLEQAKIVCHHRYLVNANWKTVIENNRECYHCLGSHPEFMVANYDLGLPGDAREDSAFAQKLADCYRRWEAIGLEPKEVNFPDGSWFRVSRFPLKDGFLTESLDEQLTAPLMGTLTDPDVGSLRLIGFPNFWAHANADYAMTTRVKPLSPSQTQIDVSFLVREDAEEGDYNLDQVVAVWKATSEQDWQLCENNYAGIRSSAYKPGPLSPLVEKSVAGFLEWYLRQMQGLDFLREVRGKGKRD